MLFFIDESLANALDSENPEAKASKNAIKLIAHSYREGNHLIYAKRETLKKIINSISDREDIGVYMKILENLPQMKRYPDLFIRYIKVVADSNVLEIEDGNGKQKIIKISASYVKMLLVSKTELLGENRTDTLLYEIIAKVYLYWHRKEFKIPIKLLCEVRGGGGSTIAIEYGAIQKARARLCLCIADSDREFPDDKYKKGGTAKKLIDIDDKLEPLCEILILDVREIENLIPISIYREVVQDENQKKTITILEKLESSNPSTIRNARKYLDIKKGLKLWRLLPNPPSNLGKQLPSKEFLAYWEPVLGALGIQFVVCTLTSKEQCNEAINKDKDKCQCIAINGLGEGILKGEKGAIVVLEGKIERKEPVEVCESLKKDWETIGEMIISWCCGSPHIST